MEDLFKIKDAMVSDVPIILSFITQLATYEKIAHEVEITEKRLQEGLFGEKACAKALIGYFNKIPVIYAVYYYTFSTFKGKKGIFIEDFICK